MAVDGCASDVGAFGHAMYGDVEGTLLKENLGCGIENELTDTARPWIHAVHVCV